MRTKQWCILIGSLLLMILVISVFAPVPVPSEDDCLVETGVVTHVFESGSKDVTLILSGNQKRYYVNRGLERGLELGKLGATLVGREVVIKYPDYWTPLDPRNSIRHISKIELDGETIFSEIPD